MKKVFGAFQNLGGLYISNNPFESRTQLNLSWMGLVVWVSGAIVCTIDFWFLGWVRIPPCPEFSARCEIQQSLKHVYKEMLQFSLK